MVLDLTMLTFWTTDASVCNSPPVIGAFENINGVPQL